MKRLRFLIYLALLLTTGAFISHLAVADGLIVSGGASLTLNNAVLDLNCLDLTLPEGGALDLGTGSVTDCGSLFVYSGAVLNWGLGSIGYCVFDTDGDGIANDLETACLDPDDADSDDDGISDGLEDVNANGVVDPGETDPCMSDTDGDGILDGTEIGYTGESTGPDTGGEFQADLDASTTTDPLNPDTDGDGHSDGSEDRNHNGRVDPGETDPTVQNHWAMPWLFLLLDE